MKPSPVEYVEPTNPTMKEIHRSPSYETWKVTAIMVAFDPAPEQRRPFVFVEQDAKKKCIRSWCSDGQELDDATREAARSAPTHYIRWGGQF